MRRAVALVLLAAPLLGQAERSYGETVRLKIDVGGEERKIALFIPDGAKKGEVFPLLVALPDTRSKAMLELGQWQQPAYDKRFCVFSVDINTSGEKGWHPKEQLEMQRDMEAVTEGMKVAAARALATVIPDDELGPEYVIPGVFNRDVCPRVAAAVAEAAVRDGVARTVHGSS